MTSMVTTDKIIQLAEAAKTSDFSALDKIIKELIKDAEKKGNTKVAKKLREVYALPPQDKSASSDKLYASSLHSNESLFEFRNSKISSSDIVLSKKNKELFDEIKHNYEQRELLANNNISLESKVLLYGLPGTGKTLFVYALAGELNIPVLHVHIDALISSYLGETGKNIKTIFSEANSRECILFLDEFDSIAKQRDDTQELGELKRVVTVLLQNMDEFSHSNLLVAATNHEHLLDKAIWRRFNYQLHIGNLDKQSLTMLYKLYLPAHASNIDTDFLAEISEGMSGAIVKQIIDVALRRHLLSNQEYDLNELLIESFIKSINSRFDYEAKKKEKAELLGKAINFLREKYPKRYTYEFLEELTGIPDSTLNNYSKDAR